VYQNLLEATRDIKTALVIQDHNTAYDYKNSLSVIFAEDYSESSEIVAMLSHGYRDYSIDVEVDYYRTLDVITTLYLNKDADTLSERRELTSFRTIDGKKYGSETARKSAFSDIVASHFLRCIQYLNTKK
jgi:hypothetical protein